MEDIVRDQDILSKYRLAGIIHVYVGAEATDQTNRIEPIIKPKQMTLEQVDLAIIDCYRRFYTPKLEAIKGIKDNFRRDYLLRSVKLIMSSSFLKSKFARLGFNPAVFMKKAHFL